jgi:hypothetical protein
MGKILGMGPGQANDAFGVIEREQLAAQVIAIMQAHFRRPGPQEMNQVLVTAQKQLEAMRLAGALPS